MLSVEAVQSAYDGSDGPLVEVRGCGCRSPLCVRCSPRAMWPFAEMVENDCKRLGCEWLAMVTLTSDPKRFPDPDFVALNGLIPRFMRFVWDEVMTPAYREKWGSAPIWWYRLEPHEGKRMVADASGTGRGRLHAHILFPALTENDGRLTRERLNLLRVKGEAMSGRTTFGWARSGVDGRVPVRMRVVRKASDEGTPMGLGYLSKGLAYLSKSSDSEGIDRLYERRRLRLWGRSDAVSRGDPKNVRRAKSIADRAERIRCLRALRREARHSGRTADAERYREMIREYYAAPVRRAPMRTHRDRVGGCGDGLTVFDVNSGEYLGVVRDVQYWEAHAAATARARGFPALVASGVVGVGKWRMRIPGGWVGVASLDEVESPAETRSKRMLRGAVSGGWGQQAPSKSPRTSRASASVAGPVGSSAGLVTSAPSVKAPSPLPCAQASVEPREHRASVACPRAGVPVSSMGGSRGAFAGRRPAGGTVPLRWGPRGVTARGAGRSPNLVQRGCSVMREKRWKRGVESTGPPSY